MKFYSLPAKSGPAAALLRCLAALLLFLPGLADAQTWVQSLRSGNEMQFLFTNSIQRYDLTSRTWLGTINLPRSGATALTGDAMGNFVAYGTAIYRYSTTYTGEAAAGTTNSSIASFFLDGNLLIAVHSTGLYARLTSYNRATGAQLSNIETYVDSLYGTSHAPGLNKIFGRTQGISPADIVVAGYTDAGVFSGPVGSPYHGTYPGAAQTFTAPDERRVMDSSGTVYSAADLTYLGSLGGTVTDLDWNGDIPIVLRGSELIAYSNTLLEAGRTTLASAGTELAVTSTDAMVFAAGSPQPVVRIVPLSQLQAPTPGQPVNPNGLPYTVDDAFQDKDGVIHLLSKSQFSLFRWSPAQRLYQSTLPLVASPSHVSYSATSHTVFTASGPLIRKMDLAAPSPVEVAFANLPSVAGGLATAGEFLYAVKSDGYMTFSPAGTVLTDSGFTYYTGSQNTYDPVRRRIYHFRDGISPNDLHYDTIGNDGRVTTAGETPYHGSFAAQTPIRVSPDGNRILIGSGVIFNAADLTTDTSLANTIADGVWKNATLFTIRLINGLTQVQNWTGAQFTAGSAVRQFSGTPIRLFNTADGLLLITALDGAPRFTLLNDALEPVYISPSKPSAPGSPVVSGRTVDSISLQWTDLSDNEDGFRIEYRAAGTTGPWLNGATTAAGATTGTVAGLTAGTGFEFRVLASNAGLLSAAPAPVIAFTLTSPDQPAGEPYFLAASRVFHNSITLVWRDNATNETGFRLLRSTTPGGVAFVRTTAANATLFTDTGLAANTTYYYRIQAVNGTADGDLSPQITVASLSAASSPAAPSQFVHSGLTFSTVRVSWQDNSTNEENFIVDRSVSPYSTWTEAGRTGYNNTSLDVSGLLPNTAYALRVRAANSIGSNASSTIYLTTLKTGGDFLGFSSESGGISYFAFSGPNRIERYHLTNRAWLAAVPMEAPATALWIDESGMYAAEGRDLIKWDLNGASRRVFSSAPSDIRGIIAAGDVLTYQSTVFSTIDKLTGIALDSFTGVSYISSTGASYDPRLKRIFMRSTGSFPGDIFFVDIGPDGKLIRSQDSPYHGTYPSASRTFVFPSGGRIVDDSGTIYTTENLAYSNSLGGALTDLAFRGLDVPIVLRGNKLLSYTNTLLEAGSFTLSSADGQRVAVNGTDALVFLRDSANTRGLSLQIVPLSSLNAPIPGQPVNPVGLPYTVDDAFLDREGVLHLYSGGQLSLFRWSTVQQAYQTTLPLSGAPAYVAYSSTNHAAYTAYRSLAIRKLDLGADSPSEVPFANLPSVPQGVVSADRFLYAVKSGGYLTFSDNGSLITDSNAFSFSGDSQMAWDPVRRRVYHFSSSSQNNLHYDNISPGGVGTNGGETSFVDNLRTLGPIRVRPDGHVVAIGSGMIINATDLTRITTLGAAQTDMTWQENLMVGLEALGTASTTVQRWSSTWTRQNSVSLGGTPLRIFLLAGNRLLVVTKHTTGEPRFHILDGTLTPVFDSVTTPPSIVRQPVSVRVPFGSAVALPVLATGSPSLAYQWYRGNTLIAGATSATLVFENAGSADAGTYKVTIINNAGTVTSSNAALAVGPVPVPAFSAGNVLVSNGRKIYEYRTDGVIVKSLNVEAPPLPVSPENIIYPVKDVAVDALGRIHLVNVIRVNYYYQYFLSSYDSGLAQWQHTLIPEITPSVFERGGSGLSINGDWAITRSYRIHLQTRESVPLPTGFTADQIVTGLDGLIYGMTQMGEIRQLSSSIWTWSSLTSLQPAEVHYGFAVAADGRMWAGNSNPGVKSYSAAGVMLKTLNLTGVGTYIADISLFPTGRMALGQPDSSVVLTNSELTSATRVALPGVVSNETYTAWMPIIAQPVPGFVVEALAPPATEDIAWSWTPQVSHPDPDAVLALSAVQLPPWLSLTAGQLTGTPLQAHTGSNSVVLSVRDGNGITAQQTFTVQVTPVNDAPMAANSSLTRSEDAPAEDVILTALFSDDETASAALAFSIISTTGGVVTAALDGPSDSSLRLTYLPDAYGTATVTVRATDAGGLFADAVITIAVVPVNDPPAGLLEPLALDEDAAAVDFNLDDFFSDIETADNALVFHVTSTEPAMATAMLSGHVLRITTQANAFGGLTVLVRCQDPDGAFVEFPLPVIVQPVNDLPAGSLADLTLDEDALPVVIDLASAFTDIETPDAALRFTAVSSAPGLVSGTLSGSLLTLTPQKDANGSTFVSVGCTDADGGLLNVRFNVNVRPVNDPPVIPAALPAIAAGDAGINTVLDFSPFVTDPDMGDQLAWRVVSNSHPSLFTRIDFDARGRLTIHYAPYVSGQATVTVEVRDQAGITAQRSFTVDLPILAAPSLETTSTLVVNRQTGLWEQRITVRNAGQRAIGGFEVTVTGLPAGSILYNASDARPPAFIAGYYQPLAAGESVALMLEYYSPTRGSLSPVLSTAAVLPREAVSTAAGEAVSIDRMLMLEPGAFLLEFTAVPGELYLVQYSTGGAWADSWVRIRAAGNRVQWIDRGAPRTSSPPQPGKSRFYRVKHLAAP